MSYTHFTLEERKYLQQLLSEKKSFREIARILGRSPSSISREVRRNRSKWKPHRQPDNPFWYNCWRAQNLYIRRRREQIRMGLVPGSDAWNYIVSGLEKYWSPEAICALPRSTVIFTKRNFRKSRQKHTSEDVESDFIREIPIITAFNPTGSSRSGRRKFACEQESATGRAIPCTAASERDFS